MAEPTSPAPTAPRTGERLLELVEVMDRLRSPGGCPWDAEQTHTSLAGYLIEEAHEAVEAIETGDSAALLEELGDVLLQVVFHARVAIEREGWGIDDVADAITEKLIRRHPHVFSDVVVSGVADVEANWETLKQAEKQRTSITDGVPAALPALARAAKLVSRADRAGVAPELPDGAGIGERLLALAAEAARNGVDPEGELRRALADWTAKAVASEAEPPATR